jgi:hypothetical protein
MADHSQQPDRTTGGKISNISLTQRIVEITACETMSLGELAQPSRGGLSNIYNEYVTMVQYTYTYTKVIQSNTLPQS